jgi:hypothetical protein
VLAVTLLFYYSQHQRWISNWIIAPHLTLGVLHTWFLWWFFLKHYNMIF